MTNHNEKQDSISFIVFIDDGRNNRIQYVGNDKDKSIEIFKQNPATPVIYDCWIEVWQGENQLNDNWRPDKELDDETWYKGVVNKSLEEVWDNEKDSLYDNE